jgi:hypothetical protein
LREQDRRRWLLHGGAFALYLASGHGFAFWTFNDGAMPKDIGAVHDVKIS